MAFYALHSSWKRISFHSLKSFHISRILLRGAKKSNKGPKHPIITAKNPFPTESLLYQNKSNQRFYHVVGLLSVLQLGVWANWAHLALTQIKEGWGEGPQLARLRTRLIISSLYMGCGIFILSAGWFYCLRSVNKIILQKGGTSVLISTYKPWGGIRNYHIKLIDMTCASGRQVPKRKYIIFTTNHKRMNFLAHSSGEIPNPRLFDETVGRRRILKMTKKLAQDKLY